MDFQELTNKLRTMLLTMPYAKPAGGYREITARCPFCGDSKKHHNSTHFYVKIPIENGDLPFFYCHLCHIKGIVTSNVLRDWRVFDSELNSELKLYNAKAMKLTKNRIHRDSEIMNLKNCYPDMCDITYKKIQYINNRLGYNFTYDDLLKFKIVPNLYDILEHNKINKLTVKTEVGNVLDEDFIGFISQDNAYINLRNTGTRMDKRWINYNVFGKWDNTRKFYVIPTTVDLMSLEPVEIIMTEGTMDILSVYINLMNKDDTNKIYTAVTGTGYQNVIKLFTRMGFIDAQYRIFSDNDTSMSYFRDIKKELGRQYFDYPLEINYNSFNGEKDFGVPIDRINLIKNYI